MKEYSAEKARLSHTELLRRRPLYNIWTSMRARTLNPNYQHYSRYGGRGITVCDEWRNSYQAFEDYMGKRPSLKHSIDRIDNDGNYEPGNVRWATRKEQMNNRKGNAIVSYNGESKTLTEWCGIFGLNFHTLRKRLHKGWTVGEALTRPADQRFNSSKKS